MCPWGYRLLVVNAGGALVGAATVRRVTGEARGPREAQPREGRGGEVGRGIV
jgi:hypothetical protein